VARGGPGRRSRTPAGARVPWLMTTVVVALAYQQSAYVPAHIKTSLHTAVPVLAGLLLTQLSIRAVRVATIAVRAALDRLQDGELVLRLPRAGERHEGATGFGTDGDGPD
jgi:uncharacterized membrane protein